MRLARWTVGFLAGMLVAAGAGRADTLRYAASWGGMPAAEIVLTFHDGAPEAFRTTIDIRTQGLPKFLSKFRGNGVSEGALPQAGGALPVRYDVAYDLRSRKERRISLRFVEAGGGRLAERGPGDSSKKPPLPTELRRDVIDPLTALTLLRSAMRAGRLTPGESFVIAAYDGKRRFDVEGTYAGTELLKIGNQSVEAARLNLMLKPLAGFDDDEGAGDDVENKPRPAVLHVTTDGNALPLRAEVKIALLPVIITFAGMCPGENDCRAAQN